MTQPVIERQRHIVSVTAVDLSHFVTDIAQFITLTLQIDVALHQDFLFCQEVFRAFCLPLILSAMTRAIDEHREEITEI